MASDTKVRCATLEACHQLRPLHARIKRRVRPDLDLALTAARKAVAEENDDQLERIAPIASTATGSVCRHAATLAWSSYSALQMSNHPTCAPVGRF